MKTAHFFSRRSAELFHPRNWEIGPTAWETAWGHAPNSWKMRQVQWGLCATIFSELKMLHCSTVSQWKQRFSMQTPWHHAPRMPRMPKMPSSLASLFCLPIKQLSYFLCQHFDQQWMILCKMWVRESVHICAIIHIFHISCKIGFSLINHPFYGVPPFMENTWNKTWFRYFWVWCSRFLRRGKSHWLSVWFGHQKDPLNGTRAAMWWETCHGGMMVGTCSKHFPNKKAVSNCYENSGKLSIKNMLGLSIPNANFLMQCIMQNENYRSIKW